MIEVKGVRKRFGSFEAVKDVTFSVHDGTVVGLLGPNGAGKTTTLRMLSGLMRSDSGSIRVDGIDVVKDPEAAQMRLGLLSESGGLYDRLTPVDHVEYFGRLRGIDRRELANRTQALLSRLALKGVANRRVGGFSRGERTKVALARALVHHPRNVVLDEPTNGLDVLSTRSVREIIRSLRCDGCSVLFSSHVMQEVSEVCDQIVVIAQGCVAAAGTADDLRRMTGCENLEDAFVALSGRTEAELT